MAGYEKLFSLKSPLYCEGAPVVITAGELYKSDDGEILAQLKILSVSDKTIIGAEAALKGFEPDGRETGETAEYKYLDLDISAGQSFGVKKPIYFNNKATRLFSAKITRVIFSDRTTWEDTETEWEEIPNRTPLSERLDGKLIEEYKKSTSSKSLYIPVQFKGLSLCSCGTIIRPGKTNCPVCHTDFNKQIEYLDEELLKNSIYQHAIFDLDSILDSEQYNEIKEMFELGVFIPEKYNEIKDIFKYLGDYKDSQKYIASCDKKIEELKKVLLEKQKKTRKSALIACAIVAVLIAFIVILFTVIIPNIKYNSAVRLYNAEKYYEAIAAFEALDGYKDSTEQITKCKNAITDQKYEDALRLFENGEYDEAISVFTELNGYKDSEEQITKCETAINDIKYNTAIKLYNEKKYDDAYDTFVSLGYKDSSEKAEECLFLKQKAKLTNVSVGSTIKFGYYEQDNDKSNGEEEIEWKVLAVENNKVLIISRYSLDFQPYNTKFNDVTWETCTLRKWLNESFYNEAFNDNHQEMIIDSTVTADKNPTYDTSPGNDTTDKVFLLSIAEVEKYCGSDELRICAPTVYTKEKGTWENGDSTVTRWWWLRTPGFFSTLAAYVDRFGRVGEMGLSVDGDGIAIRPALWIKLGS